MSERDLTGFEHTFEGTRAQLVGIYREGPFLADQMAELRR